MNYDYICMWKDLHYLRDYGFSTTFDDCDKWDKDHPLYPCLECDGFDLDCIGYKPLKDMNSDKHD